MANEKKPGTTAKKGDGKTPRERMTTVGASRVGKAIKAIRNTRNIFTRKSYEYSEAEMVKAVSTMRKEIDAVEQYAREQLSGTGGGKAEAGFTFG